jgi:hypothetical protein
MVGHEYVTIGYVRLLVRMRISFIIGASPLHIKQFADISFLLPRIEI